jgi:3-oxoacyl-[acyl-carrier-protein] synthase-1
MPAESVVVLGVGMMTAVGLSAVETAAATRSAVMRFAETDFRDKAFQPFTIAEVIEDGLPTLTDALEATAGLTQREIRLLRLAALPILEALRPLPPGTPPPGLVLSLPETRTTRSLDGARFLALLAQQVEGGFDVRQSDASDRGRAGGLAALGRAAQVIRAGHANFMLAGGVDTYRDLYVLGTLDLERRVKSAQHLDGFVPGEGAGAVLLASQAAAAAAGVTPLATLSEVSVGSETGHLYSDEPYRGEGLGMVLEQLFRVAREATPVEDVFSSMNGEGHWAKEWGVGYIRNSGAFHSAYRMHQPADCFGDTGAACGPLLVGLAALGVAQRYRRSPCLVYCSSDAALRAAVLVRAPS